MKRIRFATGDAKPIMKRRCEWMLALAISTWALATPVQAQDDQAAELAKKLSNPIASLIPAAIARSPSATLRVVEVAVPGAGTP